MKGYNAGYGKINPVKMYHSLGMCHKYGVKCPIIAAMVAAAKASK